MKKIVSVLIVILVSVLLCAIAVAEEQDFSSLTYSELAELKQKVDYEFFSRPEAEPQHLAEGQYTVGVDIAPGRYFMGSVEAGAGGYTQRIHVYKDRATYEARPSGRYGEYLVDEYLNVGEEPKSIGLEEGNFVWLQNGATLISLSAFKPADYSHYELPAGTLVPAGVYDVGEDGDIPAGKYNAFAGTVSGGEIKIYYTKEKFASDGSWHLGYDKDYELDASDNPESEGIILEDGYVVLVIKDVVLKKQPKLVFD